jgi:radical SAM superfamily enzyme YgiQ (UPF0313 family)
MKVTFIRPNLYEGRSTDAMEPLCFAILQSLTPSDVETELYDERLEPIHFDLCTDLVALTVETYTARRAYAIADRYRARGVPVVMGGYHATFLPDEALEHADAVVIGDGEAAWPKVVADAAAGRLQRRYEDDPYPSLDAMMPDRSIFRGKRYTPSTSIQYGRGCRFNCDFCSIRAFYGSNLRQRPVENVVEEIKRDGRRFIIMVDDNLFVDADKAKALFEALIPLKIKWSCQASIDVTRDKELVTLMARSGCIATLVGFESLEPASLKDLNKGWNLKWVSYEDAIATFKRAGIMIYGTFVHGTDHDTPAVFDAAADFALRHKLFLANFNPLTPTPGARLYHRLEAEGRLLYERWWLDPRYRYGDAAFRPLRMTPEQLTEGCYRARTRFNTIGSIASRLLDPEANMRSPRHAATYLLANTISRREIHAKQARTLGGPEPLLVPRRAAA